MVSSSMGGTPSILFLGQFVLLNTVLKTAFNALFSSSYITVVGGYIHSPIYHDLQLPRFKKRQHQTYQGSTTRKALER